jgi:hypothetical protein
MKTMIMIFALSLCSVCANPEGDKFRKSFDAYLRNYAGNSHCETLDAECHRGRLERMQIVADQARVYKATREADTSWNGKVADAFIEVNNVEQAFYRRIANARPGGIGRLPDKRELDAMQAANAKLLEVLKAERDEAFKRSIQ